MYLDPAVLVRNTSESESSHSISTFFITFQLLGGAGNIIILVTALVSPYVRRHPTWINFCLSWILSCTSYALLTFAGRQTGTEPNPKLCLAQAALIYGGPPVTSWATLALVIQLWYTLTGMLTHATPKYVKLRDTALVIFPYVAHITALVVALVYGLRFPASVARNELDLYCAITLGVPWRLSVALAAGAMLATMIFDILCAQALYKHWGTFRKSGKKSRPAIALAARVFIFSLYGMLAMVVCAIALAYPKSKLPYILLGMNPVASFFVFGTQPDILQALVFWKRDSPSDTGSKSSLEHLRRSQQP